MRRRRPERRWYTSRERRGDAIGKGGAWIDTRRRARDINEAARPIDHVGARPPFRNGVTFAGWLDRMPEVLQEMIWVEMPHLDVDFGVVALVAPREHAEDHLWYVKDTVVARVDRVDRCREVP